MSVSLGLNARASEMGDSYRQAGCCHLHCPVTVQGKWSSLSLGSPVYALLLISPQPKQLPAFERSGLLLLKEIVSVCLINAFYFLFNENFLFVLICQIQYTSKESKMNSVAFALEDFGSFVFH